MTQRIKQAAINLVAVATALPFAAVLWASMSAVIIPAFMGNKVALGCIFVFSMVTGVNLDPRKWLALCWLGYILAGAMAATTIRQSLEMRFFGQTNYPEEDAALDRRFRATVEFLTDGRY